MLTKALLDMGLLPENLIIAHTDPVPLPEEEYHLKIADMGAFLDFDCFLNPFSGMDALNTQRNQLLIPRIKKMLDHGYGKQITFGSDILRIAYKVNGGEGLEFIPGKFRQMLLDADITEAQLDDMMVHNSARSLSMKK